jgi:DNA-binding beta-propeller fold protein YncE
LYVSDASLDTVQVFDSVTGALTGTLTPSGGWGTPTGIAVGSNGDVYVADSTNNVVDQFNGSGSFLGTFIGTGLVSPSGLTFGPDGNLYVANFGPGNDSYISRFNSSGNPVDGSPFVPSSTGLFDPGAIAFGTDGNLYITDSSYDALDKVIGSTGAFSTLVPAGCPSTPFSNPQGLAVGPGGNLYVSDAGFGCDGGAFGVYEYTTAGSLLGTFIAPNVLSTPVDLAFGPDGNLYVTDSNDARVALFNGTTGAELPDFVASNGSAGPLIDPTFLAFSPDIVATPEPASVGLMGLGLAGLLLRRSRRSGRHSNG